MINVIEIAKAIQQNGGRLYLVGGAVRDKLCNKIYNDEDYCITGITSSKFETLFPNAIKKGKVFEVYDLDGKEFAMARKETKKGKGHTNFEIIANCDITIEEDLKRRDITINSMAQDVLTQEIIDPFGGQKDLKNGIIRATSESFKEDPLRAYRVARFSSKFNFKIENNTLNLMNKLKPELIFLSVERVFDEFRKALNSKYPQNFFDSLKSADILDVHFIEIYKLIGAIQPEKYHPEGDSYVHSMLALKKASLLTKDEKIRFSVLVHDLGKGTTPKEEYPHHFKHDINGVEEVRKLGRRLKIPNSWIKCGITSAKEHMKGGIFNNMTPKKQVEFIERLNKSLLGLKGLEIVVESDRNCRGTKFDKIEFAEIGNKIISKIDGGYVMKKYNMKPGKDLLKKIHEERILYLKNLNNQNKN